ncbi:MAG: putative motility protein [Nitrospirae bacterium]|nr:putative motility protein [Nitrospirota bacterium]
MADGVGGVGLSLGSAAQSADVSVVKKSLDIMKTQGAAIIGLIDKAGAVGHQKAAGPEGTGAVVDKYV